MKQITININKQFLKVLFICYIISIITHFILIHFGEFNFDIYGYNREPYYYYEDIFGYHSQISSEVYDAISYKKSYLKELKYYLEELFLKGYLITSVPLMALIYLLFFYTYKKINIKIT